MNLVIKKTAVLAGVFLIASCSINQSIEPSQITKENELCIIENSAVRVGFLKEYKLALSKKGIPYHVVNESSVPKSCEWTSTYIARWTWDLALYMSYAEIKVFHNGSLDGEALYDSTRGGANMNKFIDAETKIQELVDELMKLETAALFYRVFG